MDVWEALTLDLSCEVHHFCSKRMKLSHGNVALALLSLWSFYSTAS